MRTVGFALMILAVALVAFAAAGVTAYTSTAYGVAFVLAVVGAAFLLADDGS